MKTILKTLITTFFIIVCTSAMLFNSALAQNSGQNSHIDSPSLDNIFKNYEGQAKRHVPNANKHKVTRRDTETEKKNNLDFEAFLEVREFAKSKINLRSLPNNKGVVLANLKPGDMVKVKFTLHDYMRQQQAEKKNLGFWRKVKSSGVVGSRYFYFFSHWKSMQTLNPYEEVSLDVLVPQNQVSVPVFNKPGYTDWRECSQIYQLCNAFIDTYSNVQLKDAKFFEVDSSFAKKKTWELFYKVKFSYLKSDAKSASGTGWIPAKYAKRKIKPLSLAVYNLSRDRGPASIGNGNGKKFFVFNKNEKNPYIAESRWLSSTSATQLKYKSSIYDKNFAIDAIAGFNYTSLTQDFFKSEDEDLIQYGVNVGLGVSAPLYLDVDIEGSAVMSTPVSSTNDRKSTFVYLDQMFNFTIPRHWLNAPIKLGLGGYYYLMTNNTEEYGFSSLIGFHTRIKYDAKRWHAFIRYAPIGVDLGGDFKDREISLGGGYKFKPSQGYNSPHIDIDIADVFYRPNKEEETPRTLEMQKFNINYVHPF